MQKKQPITRANLAPRYRGIAYLIMAGFATTALVGQETPGGEDVYELSPFVIDSDEQGWVATQSLAGSRLKTNLNDIATQLEVLTMDFMDEYGFTSASDAAIYSLNVENEEETVTGGSGSRITSGGGLRIRGLSQGSRSRDFFKSYVKPDNYNLDRVTISSGPNGILFGTGSPAGAIDVSLSRAHFNNRGKIKVQIDNWGSSRYQIDYNRVLIDDKLSVRVALLNEDKKWETKYTGEQNRRMYATMTWKPFEKTRISAHFEDVSKKGHYFARFTPFDRISGWFRSGDFGRPTPNATLFENTAAWASGPTAATTDDRRITDSVLFKTGNNNIVFIDGYNPAGVPPMSWWRSVGTNGHDGSNWGLIDQVNKDTNGVTLLNDDYYPLNVNTLYDLDWEKDSSKLYNLFINQQILPNLHLELAAQKEDYKDFDSNKAFYNAGIEIWVDPNKYLPTGEENPYAGQLYFESGPQFLKGHRSREEWRAALSYEIDFAGKSNRWVQMLGRHQFAGMMSSLEEENLSQEYGYNLPVGLDANGRMYEGTWTGFNYTTDATGRQVMGALGAGYNAKEGNRQPKIRSYILPGGPILPKVHGLVAGEPWTVTDSAGQSWTMDPENAAVGTNGERLTTGRNTSGKRSKFDTKQISYQGYLWNQRIVLTYGYREDTLNKSDRIIPSVLWRNPETGIEMPASANVPGYTPHRSLVTFSDYDPSNKETGTTKLKGIVVHPFRNWGWKLPLGADISLSYSESNTFQPNDTQLNPDGSYQKGEEGEEENYSVRLSLFDGKFSVRYNQYDTSAGPTNLDLPFRRFRFALRPAMQSVLQGLVADAEELARVFPEWPLMNEPTAVVDKIYPFGSGSGLAGFSFGNYGDPYAMSANSKSTGDEISINWQPTKNWDFRFTWNNQSVTQTDIATQWIKFAQEFEAIMDRTKFVEGYIPGLGGVWTNPEGRDMDGKDLNPNDGLPPGIDYFDWSQIRHGANQNNTQTQTPWGSAFTQQSVKDQYMAQVYRGNAGVPVMQAYDGRPNDFVRQNRWNLNAMYRFTEGSLKGLRVGAAYRWRAKPAIGFLAKVVNGADVPDTENVLYGDEEKALDLSFGYKGKSQWLGNRNYNVGLNIRNVLPEDDYVVADVDSKTGQPLTLLRKADTQFVLSFEVDI